MSKETLAHKLRKIRKEGKFSLQKAASMSGIDGAILSKIERGERKPTKQALIKLATAYNHDVNDLMVLLLSDKVLHEIGDSDLDLKANKVAEETVSYKSKKLGAKSEITNVIKSVLKSDGRVSKAWLLGSFARDAGRPDSDVDIMIELNNKKKYSFFDLLDIAHLIEQNIKRKVDIVEKGYLRKFASQTAEKDLIKIYG